MRLKFLKSVQTEFSWCLELIQTLSLAHPDISFLLTHNGKEKFSAGAVIAKQEKKALIGEKEFLEKK